MPRLGNSFPGCGALTDKPKVTTVTVPLSQLIRFRSLACALATCLCATTLTSAYANGTVEASQDEVAGVWYADNSCRIRIGQSEEIGVTAIDADMDQQTARTLIHCDSENGTRLTLMVAGGALALGERRDLDNRNALENPVDTKIAWISRIDSPEDQADGAAVVTRRYLSSGSVIIRETPGVNTADSTLHADRQAFAEIQGVLEADYYNTKLDEQESRQALENTKDLDASLDSSVSLKQP